MATTTVNLGLSLDGLSNVDTAGKANGNTLAWNSGTGKWEDSAPSSGITIGTTAISSGTVGRILFEGAGNVIQEDSALFWDNTNKRLGVGATPSSSVRLDVRAQGALSSDIAFRVRNSANTVNMVEYNGNGDFWLRNNAGTASFAWTLAGLNLNSSGTVLGNVLGYINISPSTFVQLSTPGGNFGLRASGNISFGGGPVDGSGTNVFMQHNGTAPSNNPIDRFLLYSADIVAGNAAPHFRTENGDVVKVYSIGGWGTPTGTLTRTTFDTTTVTLSELAERVAALISDLKTRHQLLKA